jgi:HEAT repeat protein
MNEELQEEIDKLVQYVNGIPKIDQGDEKIKRLIEIGRPAIPALIEALEYPDTKDDEMLELDSQEGPAQIIGIIGVDKKQFSRIVELFRKGNTGCAFALGWINDPQGIDMLIEEFGKDAYLDMDIAIAAGLRYSGNAKALKPLTKNLNSDDAILKCEIVRALSKIVTGNHEKRYLFDEVLRELGILLRKEKDDMVREQALSSLGDMEDVLGLDIIIESIENGSQVHHALSAIKKIVSINKGKTELSKAIPSLVEMLDSEKKAIRKDAALVLGEIGDPVAVPYLIPLMNDEDIFVRGDAVQALGRIGNEEAVKALIDVYFGEDQIIGAKIEDVLAEVNNPEAFPLLIELVKKQSNPFIIRSCAAHGLGNIGDPRAIPVLVEALNDENPFVRSQVAEALGNIRDASAIPVLIRILKDEDSKVREMAAGALGKIGDESAAPALIGTLNDDDMNVRCAAAAALGNMGESIMETMTGLYTEGQIEHEVAEAFFESFNSKIQTDFDKGTVAPPKEPPKNPDEMKRIALRRICGKTRPKTGNRKPETLKRCRTSG